MVQGALSTSITSSSPLQHLAVMALSPEIVPPYPWLKEMKPEERGLCLIHLILACTKHVTSGSIEHANIALEYISQLASPVGDAMQRIAAYFTQALADRTLRALPGLHKALNATKILSLSEEVMARRLFFEHCPFLKISYLVTNRAILEAMEGERMVHVIDLWACEPAQWINFLQALSSRPDGPPHLRITGIHKSKEVLDQMAHQLIQEAENLDIPFQFNAVVTRLEDLDFESLRVKTGEALAISSVFQLHTLLSLETPHINKNQPLSPESASSSEPAGFLSALWSLSPKLVVVSEQEASHNAISLPERVMESLNFYAALFDCLESSLPRGSAERQRIEKTLFGEEIKNIVACEGVERKERHEPAEKWAARFDRAGFGRVGLSYQSVLLGRRLLESNGKFAGCRIKEEGGTVFICWQDRPLYSISSWRFRRY